ncbi:tRNA-splicing endonuclease subunit Sen15 isoform X2 [Anolis carolinensis]|uniref:tRNA-splicing endonuclease subunit Sen15 isoform X2 n=1 Tax=Anolis carolinensis TaxID=28377 RepID=UPI002F2B4D1B
MEAPGSSCGHGGTGGEAPLGRGFGSGSPSPAKLEEGKEGGAAAPAQWAPGGSWLEAHPAFTRMMSLDVADSSGVYAAFLVYLDLLEEIGMRCPTLAWENCSLCAFVGERKKMRICKWWCQRLSTYPSAMKDCLLPRSTAVSLGSKDGTFCGFNFRQCCYCKLILCNSIFICSQFVSSQCFCSLCFQYIAMFWC